jgi:hypothetical protein
VDEAAEEIPPADRTDELIANLFPSCVPLTQAPTRTYSPASSRAIESEEDP